MLPKGFSTLLPSYRPVACQWRLAFAGFLLLSLLSPVRAQEFTIPPGTPPDIAAILRKAKSGHAPTMAEVAKLQAWSQGLIQKMNPPQLKAMNPHEPTKMTLDGIPCKITISGSYTTSDSATGTHESCNFSMTAQSTLVARIDGTGDYFGTTFNPNAHVSSFQFALPLKNGKVAPTGSGRYNRTINEQKGRDLISAHFTQTAAAFTLATTGRGDDLYGAGGVGGTLTGTQTGYDDKGVAHPTSLVNSAAPLSVRLPFAAEAAGPNPKPGTQTPRPTMHLSYRQLVAAIQSGKSSVVNGTEQFSFKQGTVSYTGNVRMTISLRPKPVRLIVEPVDTKLYNKWTPLPDAEECNEAIYFGHPKPFQAHLVLQDASRPAPAAHGSMTRPNVRIGGRITVSLTDVSSEPGFCMNYPRDGVTKEGLFFPTKQPEGIHWMDDKHVETTSASAVEATVNVATRDTGAYGNIQAECTSLGLVSEYPEKQTAYLSLPLDDNGNHIADPWEKDNNIYSRNLAPDWDEEDTPSGWSKLGDGLALYEEYRGFLVEPDSGVPEEFERLKPNRRKLFLYPLGPDKPIYKAGAKLFTKNFDIDTYILHDAARLKPYGDQTYPRWMNFNRTPYTHVEQCAVWIVDTPTTSTNPGFTANIYGDEDTRSQCPQTVTYINVNRVRSVQQITNWQGTFPTTANPRGGNNFFVAAAANLGIDLKQVGDTYAQRKPILINQFLTFVVVHELGHAIGGRHHEVDLYKNGQVSQEDAYSSGDHACIMRYWQADDDQGDSLLFCAGKWDLTTPVAGGKWVLCDSYDRPAAHIKP